MKIRTDNTARIIVLALCICIVIMRLLRPEIEFDACSLGALALAALIAIVPSLHKGNDDARDPEGLRAADVEALRVKAEGAGLLMAASRGAYAALRDTRPLNLALAGARAMLALRLKALTDQARLDTHGTSAVNYLDTLNAAGMTTGDQYTALSELIRLLDSGAQCESQAGEQLLDITIGVIEMLDGTLA